MSAASGSPNQRREGSMLLVSKMSSSMMVMKVKCQEMGLYRRGLDRGGQLGELSTKK
jgi:hypothetical protein